MNVKEESSWFWRLDEFQGLGYLCLQCCILPWPMNEGAFVYARTLLSSMTFATGVVLPALYEVTHLFTNSEVIQQAHYSAKNDPDWGKFRMDFHWQSKILNRELLTLEDIGMNIHHVSWHRTIPFGGKTSMDIIWSKGRTLFWMHHHHCPFWCWTSFLYHLSLVDELWDRPIAEGLLHTTYRYGGEFPCQAWQCTFCRCWWSCSYPWHDYGNKNLAMPLLMDMLQLEMEAIDTEITMVLMFLVDVIESFYTQPKYWILWSPPLHCSHDRGVAREILHGKIARDDRNCHSWSSSLPSPQSDNIFQGTQRFPAITPKKRNCFDGVSIEFYSIRR